MKCSTDSKPWSPPTRGKYIDYGENYHQTRQESLGGSGSIWNAKGPKTRESSANFNSYR